MTAIFVFSGASGSGKTTLIERLIPELTRRGLRVAAAKHDPHGHATNDTSGKDSWRFARAGAAVVDILGPNRRASFTMRASEAGLKAALSREAVDCDVVLVEGFKSGELPRIEVVPSGSTPAMEPGTIALVSAGRVDSELPTFDREEIAQIADFVVAQQRALSPVVAVLAGGESRRMGRDKATIVLSTGETMLERAIDLGSALASRVLVVSRHEPHEPIARAAGAEFVSDEGSQHPARGVIAALKALRSEPGVVAMPCDSPGLRPEVLKRLAAASDEEVGFACFSIEGRLRPLPGYYARSSPAPLEEIAANDLPLYQLASLVPSLVLSEHEARRLDADLGSFRSINVPDDLP